MDWTLRLGFQYIEGGEEVFILAILGIKEKITQISWKIKYAGEGEVKDQCYISGGLLETSGWVPSLE